MEGKQLLGLGIAAGAILLLFTGKSGAASSDTSGGDATNPASDLLSQFLSSDDANPADSLKKIVDAGKTEAIPSASGAGASASAGASSADVLAANVAWINSQFGAEALTTTKKGNTNAVTAGVASGLSATDAQKTALLNMAASGTQFGVSNLNGTITAFDIPNNANATGGGSTTTTKKETTETKKDNPLTGSFGFSKATKK